MAACRALLRQAEHRNGPRRAGRSAAGDRVDVRQRLAVRAHEHVGRGSRRCGFAPVENGDLAGLRIVVDEERTAAEAELCGSTSPSVACTATAASAALPPALVSTGRPRPRADSLRRLQPRRLPRCLSRSASRLVPAALQASAGSPSERARRVMGNRRQGVPLRSFGAPGSWDDKE